MDDGICESFLPKEHMMANGDTTPKELHVCAGLNACYQHGNPTNQKDNKCNSCAGTGDCATFVNDSCHGNNECRGQGGCGNGGSLGSEQTAPGENLCAGKGSCSVPVGGIDARRKMAAQGQQANGDANTAITGIYEGRHVWQVARLLFEQRMIAQGRTFTTDPSLLGPTKKVNKFSPAKHAFDHFGPPPADKPLGPNSLDKDKKPLVVPDRPAYKSS
jgi:hypothetical protein